MSTGLTIAREMDRSPRLRRTNSLGKRQLAGEIDRIRLTNPDILVQLPCLRNRQRAASM